MGAMRGKEAKSTAYESVELEYGVAQRHPQASYWLGMTKQGEQANSRLKTII